MLDANDTHMHTNTHPYTHMQTNTHSYTHMHANTHSYTHMHTNTHSYTHVHKHSYTHMYTHTHTHAHKIKNTHTLSLTHTHTHTHTHTYIGAFCVAHAHQNCALPTHEKAISKPWESAKRHLAFDKTYGDVEKIVIWNNSCEAWNVISKWVSNLGINFGHPLSHLYLRLARIV